LNALGPGSNALGPGSNALGPRLNVLVPCLNGYVLRLNGLEPRLNWPEPCSSEMAQGNVLFALGLDNADAVRARSSPARAQSSTAQTRSSVARARSSVAQTRAKVVRWGSQRPGCLVAACRAFYLDDNRSAQADLGGAREPVAGEVAGRRDPARLSCLAKSRRQSPGPAG